MSLLLRVRGKFEIYKKNAFSGGVFKLELFLPEEYPMAAPKVRFMTKVDLHLIFADYSLV